MTHGIDVLARKLDRIERMLKRLTRKRKRGVAVAESKLKKATEQLDAILELAHFQYDRGEMPSSAVMAEMHKEGYNRSVTYMAKASLGNVRVTRKGRQWVWSRPYPKYGKEKMRRMVL